MATNQPEETLEYNDFLHWTVSSLKDFLALRGLKQSRLKAELIARAFGAYELNVPKTFTQEQIYEKIRKEYAKRLESNAIEIEPKELPDETWAADDGQKSTMENYSVLSCKSKLWTSIILANIKMRRRILTGRVTLFRLFFIAKCPSDSKFTSLKGNVSPQRLRDNRHQVWICVEGEKNDCRVVSSWCTCTAGTGEACNHVIALLYKVNYACNKEYISPACTRIPQGWNKGTKKEVTPNKLKHLTFRKDKKTKKA